ncbi:heme ABC exporter ATP-binding protein CcmA [Salinarimonas sp.]|uniref:heme ABC exporter ATP-binding protein CcmA n=1 Tax=Salinarimonas sp. TaxID=2766526 RepID=UPI0032D8F1E6
MRLVVEDLESRRSGRRVFEGVSFALEPGEALVVTGRNGAGKSTLLSVLSGRLRPAGGRIRVEGAGERTLPECLHLVGHRDGLKSALTAGENLAFAAALLGARGLSPREAMSRVGLAHAHDLPVAYLSAGQRRRTALARLLVAHRPLWLLDEPTSALDVGSQETLATLMKEHLADGGMLIVATHQTLGLENPKRLEITPAAARAAGATLDAEGGW